MHKTNTTRNGIRAAALLACIVGLSACSSKPGASDIQKELSEMYVCPLLAVSDLKKTDGAEGAGKQYEVAFTYTVSLKGSAENALKMYSQWQSLEEQAVAQDDAMVAAGFHIYMNPNLDTSQYPPQVGQAVANRKQINERLATVMPCQQMAEMYRLIEMRGSVQDAAKSGAERIKVPLGEKLRAVGTMEKAESGWHFTGMPSISVEQVISSEPIVYPRLKPVAAPALAQNAAEIDQPPGQLAAIDATPSDAAPATSRGPSFDCATASTSVEKMICADPKLADADAATVTAYKVALVTAADQDGFKHHHANWRKTVRDACTDAACVSRAYQERLKELK